jgi:CRP-like cAMP-binding protein
LDNRLLAALPPPLLERIQHDFKQIGLLQGHAIYEPGDQIDQIYFPQSGMISLLVVGKDGGAVETATIGREGAVGLHSALGKRVSFTRATIQISGKFSVIRAAAFTQSLQGHAAVRDLITRYTEVLWTEAQQIAACNAVHEGPARLCRWLLQTADRIGSNQLPLTQELISQMMSVRRTTVTLVAEKGRHQIRSRAHRDPRSGTPGALRVRVLCGHATRKTSTQTGRAFLGALCCADVLLSSAQPRHDRGRRWD